MLGGEVMWVDAERIELVVAGVRPNFVTKCREGSGLGEQRALGFLHPLARSAVTPLDAVVAGRSVEELTCHGGTIGNDVLACFSRL